MTKPALIIRDILFYETPSEIEGAPYWVDLWATVNGYKIGLQVKPKTYRTASLSIYSGKSRSSQNKGYKLFQEKYGGKVFVVTPENGVIDKDTENKIIDEVNRLLSLPKGNYG